MDYLHQLLRRFLRETHYLLMGWGNVDIEKMVELRAAKGLEYDAPDIPDFPEGKATFQIAGEQPPAEELIPIQSLHDLYNSNHDHLLTAYQGREQARIAHDANGAKTRSERGNQPEITRYEFGNLVR